jgi:hypothetical protein
MKRVRNWIMIICNFFVLSRSRGWREATPEEQSSVNNYIKSISQDTGVNFWDL